MLALRAFVFLVISIANANQQDRSKNLLRTEKALLVVDSRGSATSGARLCAEDGELCDCRGTVYYGRSYMHNSADDALGFQRMLKDAHKSREIDGSVACDSKEFGGEPANGIKHCLCLPRISVASKESLHQDGNLPRTAAQAPERFWGINGGSLGEVSADEASVADQQAPICAKEGELCYCSGTVFFGRRYARDGGLSNLATVTADTHKVKDINGYVPCVSAEFGGDPLESQAKHCLCRSRKQSLVEEEQTLPFASKTEVQGIECAKEGETCECNGKIYFGKRFVNGKDGEVTTLVHMESLEHKEMEGQSSVTCSEDEFGQIEGDEAKHCICKPTAETPFVMVSDDATGPPGFCASDGEVCKCSGTAFYGRRYKNDKDGEFLPFARMVSDYHEEQTVKNAVQCSAATFKANVSKQAARVFHCVCLTPGQKLTNNTIRSPTMPAGVQQPSILQIAAGQQMSTEEKEQQITKLHAELRAKEKAYADIANTYAALDAEVEETHQQLQSLLQK